MCKNRVSFPSERAMLCVKIGLSVQGSNAMCKNRVSFPYKRAMLCVKIETVFCARELHYVSMCKKIGSDCLRWRLWQSIMHPSK